MKRLWVVGAALAAAASFALAQAPGYGYGPGSGPGYGRGMMDYGPGYGPGGGHGPGMMGGYGPGMMGGGYGAGGALAALNLTDEQRDKVFAIQEEHRKKNWTAMGEMRSEQFKLRNMYRGEKVDADKVVEQQKKVDGLRQQMLKSRVETHNQIAAVLTPEQRKQLKQYSPGWLGDVEE
jgi:Spy/CpxP family protein refolding chaperone